MSSCWIFALAIRRFGVINGRLTTAYCYSSPKSHWRAERRWSPPMRSREVFACSISSATPPPAPPIAVPRIAPAAAPRGPVAASPTAPPAIALAAATPPSVASSGARRPFADGAGFLFAMTSLASELVRASIAL